MAARDFTEDVGSGTDLTPNRDPNNMTLEVCFGAVQPWPMKTAHDPVCFSGVSTHVDI